MLCQGRHCGPVAIQYLNRGHLQQRVIQLKCDRYAGGGAIGAHAMSSVSSHIEGLQHQFNTGHSHAINDLNPIYPGTEVKSL